jgi:hypothetical protein
MRKVSDSFWHCTHQRFFSSPKPLRPIVRFTQRSIESVKGVFSLEDKAAGAGS